MIVPLRKRANEIFRDHAVTGVAESGIHNPDIADIQLWFAQIFGALVFPGDAVSVLEKKPVRDWGTTIEKLLADRLPPFGDSP